MNKNLLVCHVSRRLNIPMRTVSPIVNALFECITEAILDGNKVTISLLGTFCLKERRERKAYDPYRREHILLPAGTSIRFTVSPTLQERLNARYRQNSS